MANGPHLIRSFIAIELPPEVLRTLADLQVRLGREHERAARWVAPGGIHLTLKFLGDVPEDLLPLVAGAMGKTAAAGEPLALRLAAAGCFPSAERPRVLWAGLDGDLERLARLHASIQDTMAELGFARESRGFTPHLTLARMREGTTPDELRHLGSAVRALPVPRVEFVAGEVALIRSDLMPSGAVYTILSTARLGGPQDHDASPGKA